MSQGKLYLIPTIIAEETEEKILSSEVINAIKSIKVFIVENIRTSRRYIRRIDKTLDLNKVLFYSYGKHDKLDLHADFLSNILKGKDIGIISESGVPCVADPGSKIVSFAHQFKIQVIPLVGPSSILLALMASGFNAQNFSFLGYLPINKKERIRKLKFLENVSKEHEQTQIFMETPYRNIHLFDSIITNCRKRTKLCIASNLTSPSEYIVTKNIEEWRKEKPNIYKKPTIFLLSY